MTSSAPTATLGDAARASFRLAATNSTRVRFDLIVIRSFLHKFWPLAVILSLSGACFDERLIPEPIETSEGDTNVVHAKSCLAQDVQAALSNAPDGATVQIPKGDCDWGDAKVSRMAGVWVRGAGKGQTIIRRRNPVTDHDDYMLRFDCSNGLPLEVSHLSMIGNDKLQDEATKLLDYDNGLVLDNGCRDFLIYDAEFSDFSYSGVTISGLNSRGLVHHATFNNNFKCQPEPVSCLGYGITVYGDRNTPPSSRELGTADAVFVEDSEFYGNRHAIASNYGSRFVFRHNHVTTVLATKNFGMIDPEGQGDNGLGSATWEIYRNMLDADFGGVDETCDGIYIRGGDGVVFENIISSEYVYSVRFTLEADCTGDLEYPVPGQTVDAWVWGHSPQIVEAKPGCEKYFLQDRDFKIGQKPGYKPYPYPHPHQSAEISRPWRGGAP